MSPRKSKFYFILLLLSHFNISATPATIKTSLCETSKSPTAYDGKNVSFRAIYITDLRHNSFLMDNKCPDFTIDPYGFGDYSNKKFRKFEDLVYGNINDMSLRRVLVELSGIYRYSKKSERRPQITVREIYFYKRLS